MAGGNLKKKRDYIRKIRIVNINLLTGGTLAADGSLCPLVGCWSEERLLLAGDGMEAGKRLQSAAVDGRRGP